MVTNMMMLTHMLALTGGYALGIYLATYLNNAYRWSEGERVVGMLGLLVVMFIVSVLFMAFTFAV